MVAALFSPSKDPFLLYSLKGNSWNSCGKLLVELCKNCLNVVVVSLGPYNTNYEGLMIRVTCDTKGVNTIVRTYLEVVVHCPEESDYFF